MAITERPDTIGGGEIRDDFVPKDSYLSPEWARLEMERLWPHVWQVACREEELRDVGDYVEYQIGDESIIVLRSEPGTIGAFYNTCQHRGRRLIEGEGNTKQFRCPFHGWRYGLDGTNVHILDEEDFDFSCADASLVPVRCETWGGFVFVNMDDGAAPLREHLSPLDEILGPFEFEKMRYRWYKSTVLPCNWKMALDAFNEAYHVPATHPQLLPYSDDRSESQLAGPHGGFRNVADNVGIGIPSPRLQNPAQRSTKELMVGMYDILEEELAAIYSRRDWEAAQRIPAEAPEGISNVELAGQVMMWQAEAAAAEGAGWPEITMEQFIAAGTDWQIFPNAIAIQYADGLLFYRTRPNGLDPDSCIHDVWSLVRYAPGEEPPLERQRFADWHDHDGWGRILTQDFQNMAAMQQGIKSRGFKGLRLNPKQERAIANYHREIRRYLFGS